MSFAQASFSTPLPFNGPAMTLSTPVNQTLLPGTYYIVASTPAGANGGGWIQGGPPTVGDIPLLLFANSPNNDSAFPTASNCGSTNDVANFQVLGTQVPEAVSLALLCSGLVA
jgi:hypothetical protein